MPNAPTRRDRRTRRRAPNPAPPTWHTHALARGDGETLFTFALFDLLACRTRGDRSRSHGRPPFFESLCRATDGFLFGPVPSDIGPSASTWARRQAVRPAPATPAGQGHGRRAGAVQVSESGVCTGMVGRCRSEPDGNLMESDSDRRTQLARPDGNLIEPSHRRAVQFADGDGARFRLLVRPHVVETTPTNGPEDARTVPGSPRRLPGRMCLP